LPAGTKSFIFSESPRLASAPAALSAGIDWQENEAESLTQTIG